MNSPEWLKMHTGQDANVGGPPHQCPRPGESGHIERQRERGAGQMKGNKEENQRGAGEHRKRESENVYGLKSNKV